MPPPNAHTAVGVPPNPPFDRPPPKGPPKPNDRDNQSERKSSPSPTRSRKVQRGRSQTCSILSAPRSTSANAYLAELDVLQYSSIHSRTKQKKKPMSTIFRRPLTPKTYAVLKGSYFFNTNPARFKTVMRDGRCLRCWSSSHRAAACPAYTRPTPTPCKFCHHLFHPSHLCLFYNAHGKPQPASRATSPK